MSYPDNGGGGGGDDDNDDEWGGGVRRRLARDAFPFSSTKGAWSRDRW